MRYFIDAEFIEDGKTIDLISIGIVAEDGREFYAISNEFNPSKASQWVADNVLSHLPPRFSRPPDGSTNWTRQWQSKDQIRSGVAAFCGCIVDYNTTVIPHPSPLLRFLGQTKNITIEKPFVPDGSIFVPEFWAYYADYDWVVFCQLFGTMMDLPKGFPMYCKDIKQLCDDLGNPSLPKQTVGKHNALEDARHNKLMYEFLQNYKESM